MASEIEEPKQGQSPRKLWRVVAKCVKFINALCNLKLVVLNDATDAPTAKLQVADANAVLELHFVKSSGGGTVDVAVGDASGYSAGTGVGEVDTVSRITFDQDNFELFDGGDGEAVIKLKTCPATCAS